MLYQIHCSKRNHNPSSDLVEIPLTSWGDFPPTKKQPQIRRYQKIRSHFKKAVQWLESSKTNCNIEKHKEKLTHWAQHRWCSYSPTALECGVQQRHCSCRNGVDDFHSSYSLRKSFVKNQHQDLPSSRSSLPWRLHNIAHKIQQVFQDAEQDKRKRERVLTSSHIIPVRVIRSKLLELSSLHNIRPLWQLHLFTRKQMPRKSEQCHM